MSETNHETKHEAGMDVALAELVEHLEHVLPSQAPLRDFVHHNTLHGYQHLPFDQALVAAREDLGISGFWSPKRFREEYAAGRIDASDLEAVLDTAHVAIDDDILPGVTRRSVWRAALRFDCQPRSEARLNWELANGDALQRIPEEIATESRRWRDGAKSGELSRLWASANTLADALLISEQPAYATDWPGLTAELGVTDEPEPKAKGTLRELILQLTGEDILDTVRADLIRHCAAHLDQGLAAWSNPGRSQGFYAAWRAVAARDPSWTLDSYDEAKKRIAALPDSPVVAIEAELRRMALPQKAWPAYLERLALQLPGWSGMFLWRQNHPGYVGQTTPVALADYLAVRLILEGFAADAVTHRTWGVTANLTALASYFWLHPVELQLRLACHRGELSEALASRVQQMEAPGERAAESRAAWDALAREADAAAQESAAPRSGRLAWPLFRLALCLGLDDVALNAQGAAGADVLLACAAELDDDRMGYLWLLAYERHYAEQIYVALTANHGRVAPDRVAEAQLVVCMDDREEGFRRHLEEVNPRLETLGAAAHFGVFQNWRALGDKDVTPLCPVVPVVIKPSHEVREVPRQGQEEAAQRWLHAQTVKQERLGRRLQLTRFGLLSATLGSLLLAPVSLAQLLTRSLAPRRAGGGAQPPTQLALNAAPDDAHRPATPEAPRLGFNDDEQAERIGNFLTGMGLVTHFAPLVVIMGHGSNSQNNPHLSAYDCGACAGRHSGPNARLFAAMANRLPVRERLANRGIAIPAGTYFIGAEHNTCDDTVDWWDLDDVPAPLAAAKDKLLREVRQAGELHAVERCRRLMSAPLDAAPAVAWRHIAQRREDFAQPRPELGHVTNACAFIGRRYLSRGVFFDRRAFLISYDPTHDPDAAVLTRHLTINGPVGAGINLEYYFSTVSNERYGSGTKTMHNVAGNLGVMAGGSSDLRTGLPLQMVEIHEPMRLLVVVEQSIEVLTQIYQAQPAVQELVGKGWLLLAALEPIETSGGETRIHRFDTTRGWIRWHPSGPLSTPEVDCSADWFAGHRQPLPPSLLTRPVMSVRA